MLMNRGFGQVRPLLGGIDAWADAGYQFDEFSEPGIVAARTDEANSSLTGGNT